MHIHTHLVLIHLCTYLVSMYLCTYLVPEVHDLFLADNDLGSAKTIISINLSISTTIDSMISDLGALVQQKHHQKKIYQECARKRHPVEPVARNALL